MNWYGAGAGAPAWERDGGDHPREAGHLRLDIAKARTGLGWNPVLSLGPALEWIVEWYRAYQAGNDLRTLTLAQIARFEALQPAGRVPDRPACGGPDPAPSPQRSATPAGSPGESS